jgi:hypothetical protein
MSSVYEQFVKTQQESSKHINLGWTITSWIYTGSFFLGLLLVAMLLVVLAVKPEYRNNSASKKSIIILGWVGFGLILFGLWTTINSFYTVVQKINQDVRIKRGCSLFNPENARNAVETIAADENLDDDLADFINARKNNVERSNVAGDEYLSADASSRLSRGSAPTASRSIARSSSSADQSSDSSDRSESIFDIIKRAKRNSSDDSSSSKPTVKLNKNSDGKYEITDKDDFKLFYQNILRQDKHDIASDVYEKLKIDELTPEQANEIFQNSGIPAILVRKLK